MIPKRIIQTWKTREIPREFRGYQKSLRELNPDYEFMLFTDEEVVEFVAREYPQYLDAFNAFPEIIYKVDLFRLLAIHKLGGIYLDLDVYPVKPFDELLDHECVFPFESQHNHSYFAARYGVYDCIGQFAFAAKAGHPFLLACVENICQAALNPDFAAMPPDDLLNGTTPMLRTQLSTIKYSERVLYASGPAMVTRTFVENLKARYGVEIIFVHNEATGMKFWHCFGQYGVHRVTGSWWKKNSLLVRLIYRIHLRRKIKMLAENSRQEFVTGLQSIERFHSAPPR